MIFCDTSVAAKYYVPETDSAKVTLRLEAEDRVCMSELARAELMSVFHRRLREKRWSQQQLRAMVSQFAQDDLGGFWHWLPLDQSMTKAAAQVYATLPESVFLRASDCLHLVTAFHHQFTEVYTYDTHQAAAAPVLGLKAMMM